MVGMLGAVVLLLVLISLHSLDPFVGALLLQTRDMTERCLNTSRHLGKPSHNEEPLADMCSPWSSKSCCSAQIAREAHQRVNHLTFDVEHCGPMSDQCHRMFVRELCYYSCDPYIAPWLIQPDRSFPQERLMMVPMCRRDCNQWWEACKGMSTCVRNWRKHFDLLPLNRTSGVTLNKCPKASQCRAIGQIYSDAQDFCETVWDHTWKVVNDSEKCVHLSFPANQPNPNQGIAQFYLTRAQRNAQEENAPAWFNVLLFLLIILGLWTLLKFVPYVFRFLCCCCSTK